MDIAWHVLLGALQGLAEWLPVSSEGVVSALYSHLFDEALSDSVAYSLWLHVGTGVAAVIAFRREVYRIVHDGLKRPLSPSPLLTYLLVSTIVSGIVGVPLLIFLDEVSDRMGGLAMAVVGLLMLVTGGLQLRKGESGERGRDQASTVDAVMAGLAQGFAALPGLSRSGLTVALLLARHIQRRDALVLSFLMSIPASFGAALYSVLDKGLSNSGGAVLAAVIACLVGIVTIKALLQVAERINFAVLVIAVGVLLVLGAAWQALT